MYNLSSVYLEAKKNPVILGFSGAVTTVTTDLKGPGGASGDGFPIPLDGAVERLLVYDGSTVRSAINPIDLSANDRISMAAVAVGGSFTVSLRINNASTSLQVTGCAQNTTLFVTVMLQCKEE